MDPHRRSIKSFFRFSISIAERVTFTASAAPLLLLLRSLFKSSRGRRRKVIDFFSTWNLWKLRYTTMEKQKNIQLRYLQPGIYAMNNMCCYHKTIFFSLSQRIASALVLCILFKWSGCLNEFRGICMVIILILKALALIKINLQFSFYGDWTRLCKQNCLPSAWNFSPPRLLSFFLHRSKKKPDECFPLKPLYKAKLARQKSIC